MTPYTHISDLAKEAQPPEKGILSRTLYNDEKLKAVIFGFGQGEATVGLGDDKHEAKAGTWVHMPTGQRHSIQAKTPVVMLLLLLK